MPCCHLAQRALLRLSGPDVRLFLQGQITNDMQALTADAPLYAGLLSPQGKALFDLFLFADGDDVLIDVAADRQAALAQRLTMFRLRRQMEIAPAAELAVYAGWGEASAHPVDPRLAAAGQRWIAPAAAGQRWITPAAAGQRWIAPAGAVTDATLADWHAHRLPLGLPEADEIGHDELLWLETNGRELNGVSFTKGCYTGQENTARMHHRDKLRKRLLPLQVAENAPAEGPVLSGDREAGMLRGQRHADLQMALIRMDFLDQPLTLNGSPAELLTPSWLTAES